MIKSVSQRIAERKELFIQLWKSGQRSESIAAIFLISTTTVNQWGKRLGLPRRYLGPNSRPFLEGTEFTPDELRFAEIAIHERAAAIRLNWDCETEVLRRAVRPTKYAVTRYGWAGNGFVEAGPPKYNALIDSKMMVRLMREKENTRVSLYSPFN